MLQQLTHVENNLAIGLAPNASAEVLYAMKRQRRRMSTAIRYAAFSPREVLTVYDMMEDYSNLHAQKWILARVKTDSTPDFCPRNRRYD